MSPSNAARFLRAALDEISLEKPRFSFRGTPRLFPVSEGAANFVARVDSNLGPVIVKLRADASDDAIFEAQMIKAFGDLGPTLVHASTMPALIAHASARGDFKRARALDVNAGGILLMRAIGGAHPTIIDDGVITRTAEALAALWKKRPGKTAPTLRTPSSPQGVRAIFEQLFTDLMHSGMLDGENHRRVHEAATCARRALSLAAADDDWERVRLLCHGDLRWHNLLDDGERVRFIDMEHAGVGDPALDVAMMIARTPLSLDEEHALLDELCRLRCDRTFLNRVFGLRPMVALLGGVSGMIDLLDVRDGHRSVAGKRFDYIDERLDSCVAELSDAVTKCIDGRRDPWEHTTPPLFVSVPPLEPDERRTRASAGPGIVAIDGTAASGKSVLAKIVADHLGIPHLNTGMAFRRATLLALTEGVSPDDERAMTRLAKKLATRKWKLSDDGALADEDGGVDASLTTFEIDEWVALYAQHAVFRRAVWSVVSSSLSVKHAVIEGRDIGTTMFPNTKFSFFVDADERERARRVHERLAIRKSLARVQKAVRARDMLDRSRDDSPMKPRSNAVLVDTTKGSGEENAKKILRAIQRRG